MFLLKCRNSETCNKKEKTPFHDHLEYLPKQNPLSGGGGWGRGGGLHIDLLTPSLSTMERLRPRLNVQSVVGNRALLLWLRSRGVTPSARSSGAPLLLLPHTPRRGCLQRLRIPNSRGHTEAWESVSPTQGVTPKRGSPYPQLKGPHQSMGVRIPNSRGLQRGGENCEPVILNSTGRLTNWPGFLNSTGRLKAHNWADGLHHPCLLGVPMVGRNDVEKKWMW